MTFRHLCMLQSPQVEVYDEFAVQKSFNQAAFWTTMAYMYNTMGNTQLAGAFLGLAHDPFTIDKGINKASGTGVRAYQRPVVASTVAYKNGSDPVPLHPFRITIPQKSNRYSWGPWYKYSQKRGKTEVETNDQLRPEVFGGDMALLDECAFALTDVALADLYASEAGTVELAEFPRHNYAERFNDNGPYVTSMEVGVGVGGITTSYQFSTWTRNFGKIAKYNVDRIARINKNKIKALKAGLTGLPAFPTKQNISSHIPQQQAGDFNNNENLLIAGIMVPSSQAAAKGDQSTMSVVSTSAESFHHTLSEDSDFFGTKVKSYDVMFGCTMEQIFSPIGLRKTPSDEANQESLPYIINHKTAKNIEGKADTFGEATLWDGGVRPMARALDPYYLPRTTDFSVAMMNTYGWFTGDESIHFENHQYSPRDVAEDIRTFGLRGPLLLSGWGYDMAGMPVPAKDDKMDGYFFPDNPALNRAHFKSGPVDLMWDDERQVWAGGLSFIEGTLIESIEPAESPDEPDTNGRARIRRRKWSRGDQKYEWKRS